MKNLQEIEQFKDNFFSEISQSFSGVLSLWDELLFSFLLLLFGWFLGSIIEKIFVNISEKQMVANLSKKIGFDDVLKKAEIKKSFGKILGSFLKGYIFTLSILSSSKILGIDDISTFLESFLLYVPKLLIAFVIIVFGIQISNTTYSIISSGFKLVDSSSGKILAGIFKGIIITFSVLTALVYLEIQPFLVNVLFIGFVSMIVIAGGLSFGLGGQKTVEKFLENIREKHKNEKK